MSAPVLTSIESNTGSYGAGVNNVVTGSVTAASGPYILAICGNMSGTFGYTISGAGLSWSTISELDCGGGGNQHVTAYLGTGTPTTGAITATPKGGATGNNRAAWDVINCSGLSTIDNVSTSTNPFGNTTPVSVTITGTPDADTVSFCIADSGRDLSGALLSWSTNWTGLADQTLNSHGDCAFGWSSTHDQSPTATFTSTFNNAFPAAMGMLLHGVTTPTGYVGISGYRGNLYYPSGRDRRWSGR